MLHPLADMSARPGRLRPRLLLLFPLLSTLLVGCSDEGAQAVSVAVAVAATKSSHTARMELVSTYGEDEASTATEGVVDFDDGAVQTETRGTRRGKAGLLMISVGGETFLGTTDPPRGGPGWVRLPALEPGPTGMSPALPLEPEALVDALKQSATTVSKAGSDRVRGEATTTYRVNLRAEDSPIGAILSPSTTAKATMDVDGRGRLRRLVVVPDAPVDHLGTDGSRLEPPLLARLQLELWDFGVDVDIRKPRGDDVLSFDDAGAGELMSLILSGLGDMPHDAPEPGGIESSILDGPFTKLTGGHWEDVAWEVWEAPTTDGTVCQTLELTPPPATPALPEGLPPSLVRHGGVPATCGPRADLFREADPVQLFGGWSSEATYWYMAGTTAPEISMLEVGLANGQTIRIAVDPRSHVFTLFRRAPLSVKEVRADAGKRAAIVCVPEEAGGFGLSSLNCSG